jgi:hypothetical protein
MTSLGRPAFEHWVAKADDMKGGAKGEAGALGVREIKGEDS